MEELQSERLNLRKIEIDDYLQVFSCWASDDEVTRYLTWPTHQTPEITKRIVAQWVAEYEQEGCYRYGIELKTTGELIGMIDVVGYIDHKPMIGYVLGKKYWNHGFMTEALETVLIHLSKIGYTEVLIEADERNIGSNTVIQRNGFKFWKKETKQCSSFKPEIVTVNWYCKNI